MPNFTLDNQLQAPVVIVVFNRPDLLKALLGQIKLARPKKVYVLADAPRVNNPADAFLCSEVRKIIDHFDLGCDVIKCYRTENLGCKKNIETGLNWFFEQEESGIILEDDCLPNLDFFRFCDQMLKEYKDDSKIFSITGDNFQNNQPRGSGEYYVSKYMHCWGWATWRRAWKSYDGDISFWPSWKNSPEWNALNPNPGESKYWIKIFDAVHNKEINSWAYPWLATSWYFGGNTITPNVNLVKNVGFGANATNTQFNNGLEGLQTHLLPKVISSPDSLEPDLAADRYAFYSAFKMPLLRKIGNRLLPLGNLFVDPILNVLKKYSNTTAIPNYELRRCIESYSTSISGRVLDFGCGAKPYEFLFKSASEYIGLDTHSSGHNHNHSRVDIYFDGDFIPFPDESFDAVLAFQVLEHIKDPASILAEIRRVLKTSGKFLITAPLVWPEHEVPYDFNRWTSYGIAQLLKVNGYEIIQQKKVGNRSAALVALFLDSIEKKRSYLAWILVRAVTFVCNVIFLTISRFSKDDAEERKLYLDNIVLAKK